MHLSQRASVVVALLIPVSLVTTAIDKSPSLGSSPKMQRVLAFPGAIRFTQHWSMFAPEPATADAWYAITGVLSDGSRVNLFEASAKPVDSKPQLASRTYPGERWRKLLFQHYRFELWEQHRSHLLTFLVNRWDRENPTRVVRRAEVRMVVEETGAPGAKHDIKEEVLATYP